MLNCCGMYFPHFSLTPNVDEILHDKIIEHAYIRVQPRDQRGVKIPPFYRQKAECTPHHPRAGKRRKMRNVGALFDAHALVLGIGTCCASPQGTEESHIHGIYGGIALLEHLRTTMTMHRDALLRARRAIRVMHQDALSDFLSLFLFLSQFLRIVTQRRPVLWDSHCIK